MGIIEDFLTHQLSHIDPAQIIGAVRPAVEAELKSFGSQDVDHDGQPDFQEAMAAAKEVEDGLVKLAGLVGAYREKYLPAPKGE